MGAQRPILSTLNEEIVVLNLENVITTTPNSCTKARVSTFHEEFLAQINFFK